MTPAIDLLKKKKLAYTLHSYQHDHDAPSYGLEAAEALSLDPSRVYKTLLVSPPGGKARDLAVAIVPVDRQLDLKSMAAALNLKKLEMADTGLAQKVTGYLVGGISPLGQKKPLTTLIDASALQWETVFFSGGKRGLEIELAPTDLAHLCNARFVPLARPR